MEKNFVLNAIQTEKDKLKESEKNDGYLSPTEKEIMANLDAKQEELEREQQLEDEKVDTSGDYDSDGAYRPIADYQEDSAEKVEAAKVDTKEEKEFEYAGVSEGFGEKAAEDTSVKNEEKEFEYNGVSDGFAEKTDIPVERLTEVGTERGVAGVMDAESFADAAVAGAAAVAAAEAMKTHKEDDFKYAGASEGFGRKEHEMVDPGVQLKSDLESARKAFASTDYKDRGMMQRLRKALNLDPKGGKEETPDIKSSRESYEAALKNYKDHEFQKLKESGLTGKALEGEMKKLITYFNCDEVFSFADARHDARMEELGKKEGKGFFKRTWDKVALKSQQAVDWYDKKVPLTVKLGMGLATFIPGVQVYTMGKRALGAAMMGAAGGMKIDKLAQLKDRAANKFNQAEILGQVGTGFGENVKIDFDKFDGILNDKIKSIDQSLSQYTTRSQINTGIAIIMGAALGVTTASAVMDYMHSDATKGAGGILGKLWEKLSGHKDVPTATAAGANEVTTADAPPLKEAIPVPKAAPDFDHHGGGVGAGNVETPDNTMDAPAPNLNETIDSVDNNGVGTPNMDSGEITATVENAPPTPTEIPGAEHSLNNGVVNPSIEEAPAVNPGTVQEWNQDALDADKSELTNLNEEYRKAAETALQNDPSTQMAAFEKMGSTDAARKAVTEQIKNIMDGTNQEALASVRGDFFGHNIDTFKALKDVPVLGTDGNVNEDVLNAVKLDKGSRELIHYFSAPNSGEFKPLPRENYFSWTRRIVALIKKN